MSDPNAPSLFESSGRHAGGERWVATGHSRGPWDPRHCHGGPVSALLARAVERADVDQPVDWQIARLTIELTRPVPVGRPLEVHTEIERPGRKVSLVAVRLVDDDTEVARVRALRIRHAPLALPDHPTMPVELPGAHDAGRLERVTWAAEDRPAFHVDGAEHRVVEGSWAEPGPIAVWIRLRCPVVPGEAPTGVQRAAAAADFGNGVSSALPYDEYLYINPDLTVHLARPPEGEWIGMRTASSYGAPSATGAGFAESALHDRLGRVGRSVQSLLVEPR